MSNIISYLQACARGLQFCSIYKSLFDFFRCQCERGYKGKQCQDMEFCETRGCPTGGKCRNLPHGYECVSNVTMNGSVRNTSLQYSFHHNENPSTPVGPHSIDLMYRSKTGGTLLYLCNQQEHIREKHLYFFVFVFNDKVSLLQHQIEM